MSVIILKNNKEDSFKFNPENLKWAKGRIAKYPTDRSASAIVPLLWRAQKQNGGWLSRAAMEYIGEMLGMAKIRVLEVVTFYTMFNLQPIGEHHVQLCGTTPCWLRGADDLKKVCEKKIGPKGSVSEDGKFSWVEVECLGACVNAPMVQINDDYFEDLDPKIMEKLLDDLAKGKKVKVGSQNGRIGSAPEGGPTTLLEGKSAQLTKKAPAKKVAAKTTKAKVTKKSSAAVKQRNKKGGGV